MDISDPARPRELGRVGETRRAEAVAVEGQFAYVLDSGLTFLGVNDGPRRLLVVALTTPAAPAVVGRLDLGGAASGELVVRDGWVFVSRGATVEVVEARDPRRPRLAHTLATAAHVQDLTVSDARLYLAESATSGWSGVEVFDVTDPSAPRWAGAWTGGWPRRVRVVGREAYVASSDGELAVFRLTDVGYGAVYLPRLVRP
jgi:hypothetical protein